MEKPLRALVTGGGGFLGKAIVRQLLKRGAEVTILARSSYPEVEELGAKSLQLDITKKDGLEDACEGMDVVFHVAALAGVWGPREKYFSINVEGTRNMLAAAKAAGVPKFVYTSSPSAVWNGDDEEFITEEDTTYPDEFMTDYPESKAEAEKLALAANCPEMAVCALRPHLIWGAGDPHLVPRILDRYKRLRIIGDGTNLVGICHVENGAHAHLLAADRLSPDSVVAGKAYFITDIQPVNMWSWLNLLLERLEKDPIIRKISAERAFQLGKLMEWVWKTFNLSGEPFMTRFVARQLSSSHYYNLSAAQDDLDYEEVVEPKEAFNDMVAYFQQREAGKK